MGRQLVVTIVGSIVGVGIAVVSGPVIPLFNEALSRWQYVAPTCGDPRGLDLLDIGAMQSKKEATVAVSSDISLGKTRGMLFAFDGRPGSGWVPTTSTADDADESVRFPKDDWMELTFTSPQPIVLVCAVNGKASDWDSYIRADRARTVEVSFGDGEQKVLRKTSLRTLPQHELQDRQELKMPDPKARGYDRVKLTVLDLYLGSPVEDPNTGEAVDPPTGLVMLGEVELWVQAKKQ
jgi:hypothetical protein